MAQTEDGGTSKKHIRIDVSSDSVCPWCFVGKKNLDKAIAESGDGFEFEIRWHPFFLDPSAPQGGVNKLEHYRNKFGQRIEGIIFRMTETFKALGLNYNMNGLTGNTMDSHRLIYFAGRQEPSKQHKLVETLFVGYFTQARYIGDREFLLECAQKAGIQGAREYLEDPHQGVNEVKEEAERFSGGISGVPYFVINGEFKLSGAQSPETFAKYFAAAARGQIKHEQ